MSSSLNVHGVVRIRVEPRALWSRSGRRPIQPEAEAEAERWTQIFTLETDNGHHFELTAFGDFEAEGPTPWTATPDEAFQAGYDAGHEEGRAIGRQKAFDEAISAAVVRIAVSTAAGRLTGTLPLDDLVKHLLDEHTRYSGGRSTTAAFEALRRRCDYYRDEAEAWETHDAECALIDAIYHTAQAMSVLDSSKIPGILATAMMRLGVAEHLAQF